MATPAATRTLYCADLFCGSGGTSTGLLKAAKKLGYEVNLVAVNHWDTAIETHTANHPEVTHYCENLETVNPRHAVPSGHLHLLVASPECTHHSNARGGRPMSDQSRATAWHILRWAEALHIENILIENVMEFKNWGPLHGCTCTVGKIDGYGPHERSCKMGRPIEAMKGRLYKQFLASLRALGYTVGERILNAADYGDATTRQRLFIQARRGTKRPAWPAPTHIKPAASTSLPGLFDDMEKWRAARKVIDWSLEGKSIYNRKKPLRPATMARIYAGLKRFSGLPFVFDAEPADAMPTMQPEPFLVKFYTGSTAASVDNPLPTVTANYEHLGLAQPFLVGAGGPVGAGNPQSIEEPLGTILGQNHRAVVQPYLVVLRHNSSTRNVDDPLPTLTAGGTHLALAEPYLVVNRTHSNAKPLSDPLPTLTTGGNMALCKPYLMAMEHSTDGHERRCYSPDRPLPTITSKGQFGFVEPFLTEFHGGKDSEKRIRSIEEPICTLDTSNRVALAEPFLINYYGQGQALSVDDPLDTVTGKDRFALISPSLITKETADDFTVIGWLDIRFRMLQWRELASAMSFPEDYQFAGNREDKVKQIGNSVAVRTAEALCTAILKNALY